ncbi:MAG TPA: hypothetical protein VFN13_12765 [Rudaea sp.]|nr:hypothetical protein [Rudaea sp.]
MDTTLVFGATGAVGRFVLQQLTPRNRVIGVSRQRKPGPGHWICADLNDPGADWPDVDVIISLGPLDCFAHWLQGNPLASVKRVVALSSMSAQSKRDSVDVRERETSARLRQSETRILNTCANRNIACTMFRPTLIYGAGTDRSLAPIARFARRWRILPIPAGAAGLRQPIHAADIAWASAAVLDRSITFGKTYPLGGGERLRFDTLVSRLRRCSPGFVMPLPVPIPLLRLASKCRVYATFTSAMVARLREPLIADNSQALRDFGFTPRNFCPEQVLPEET